jgi:hypothetical protein
MPLYNDCKPLVAEGDLCKTLVGVCKDFALFLTGFSCSLNAHVAAHEHSSRLSDILSFNIIYIMHSH